MTLEDKFISHGTSPDLAAAAAKAFAENESLTGIAVSGKIAAGKDTLAPLLLREIDPHNPMKQLQFAFALKNEVSQVLELIRSTLGLPADSVALLIADQQSIPVERALDIFNYVHQEFLDGTAPKDGWDKTPGNRLALQAWGTQVRRAQKDSYWVDKVVQDVAIAFSEGFSVYVTDTRFPNELAGCAELGFNSFRIDVSPEEQKRRFFAREGVELEHAATLHDSEVSLDDCTTFTSRVLTDGLSPTEAVEALLAPVS